MHPYIPKIGEIVEVSFVGEVIQVKTHDLGTEIMTRLKLDSEGKMAIVTGIPMVVVTPFEPVRSYEKNRANAN